MLINVLGLFTGIWPEPTSVQAEIKFSPKVAAALLLAVGLAAIAMQAYELNKLRVDADRWLLVEPTGIERDTGEQEEKARASLAELRQMHLMGNPEVSSGVVQQTTVVDTNLKLELVGTIRGSLGNRDSALIAAKGGEAKRYYVGDEIDGGAVLESVSEEMVVLRRGRQLENLRYSRSSPPAMTPGASTQSIEEPQETAPPAVVDQNAAPTESRVNFRERFRGKNRALASPEPEQN